MKQLNKVKIKPGAQRAVQQKEKTNREKALEFAKSIAKPKQKKKDENYEMNVINEEADDDDVLREFEQRNQYYRQQLENL